MLLLTTTGAGLDDLHSGPGVGAQDLSRAASDLAARIPEPLAGLARLAYNYRWSWLPGGTSVFRSIDPPRWRTCGGNPVRLLQETSSAALARAAGDAELLAQVAAFEQTVAAELRASAAPGPVAADRPVAFLCAEYAVHQSLPIYSGGLGALAGDILKQASDRRLPLVAVGLMYRRGYFRQRIDASGWQQEYWVPTDPERIPGAVVTTADGAPLMIRVRVREQDVHAQIWRIDVGRVPLFLLDTDVPANDGLGRLVASRLYDSDTDTRLAQYVLLGVGSIAALGAMGIDPGVVHLNEGHAAWATLAMARERTAAGATFEDAIVAARERTVFTTHTPVPAGNDTYPADQIGDTLRDLAGELGVDPDVIVRFGRTHPDDGGEPFGVTQFALRTSRAANAVSRRHGEVARRMWRELWPDRAEEDVPITHVTNGVHIPSWIGQPMRELLDRHLQSDWRARSAEPETWAPVDAIPDAELWAVRQDQRRRLVDFVRERSVADRVARGEPRAYIEAAARAFDPDVLTIGVARRLATYKRLHLLLHDPDRALGILAGDRPVQILLAGKAHPRDDEAKRMLQNLFGVRDAPRVGDRVVFLEDYDLGVAARLVRGCDVWVNLPRPPMEASGTSGMKSMVNGGLQLSVLDGWWAEAFDGTNGWGFSGDEDHDQENQDRRDAGELYRLLEDEVIPAFHDRGDDGIPHAWIERIKSSMRTLGPAFCANRMLRDDEARLYAPHRER
ncbi:MAG: alpha-glucan family phosphorylase [Solirubrobacteraceae bacterium]